MGAVASRPVEVGTLTRWMRLREVLKAKIMDGYDSATGKENGQGMGGNEGEIRAIPPKLGGEAQMSPCTMKGNDAIIGKRRRWKEIRTRLVAKVERETMGGVEADESRDEADSVVFGAGNP